ncbi:hypothetical protein BaRGS_00008645 [Batillaria attramentaria]|uniref:Bcl-2 Bcl-2 homology region 1-3 domain-containing protein n=1 Tax=Batillaria attramentaria TaxID=370345 RepID=A0ABD0LLN3_9CAEN
MASWNGSSDSDGEEPVDGFLKPSSAQMQLVPRPPEEIHPDSEENVKEETEGVFMNFVYQTYRSDNIQQSYDNMPVDPALVDFPSIPDTSAAEIGRQLARIGDVINERYKDTFIDIIDSLGIGPDTAYEAFAEVAKRIFADGINWGRILTLLSFGYRIAIQVLKNHASRFAEFLGRICKYVLTFLISEKITRWIADHGGWRAALAYIPSVDTSTFVTILGLAAVSIIAVIAWHRYSV